MKNANKSTALPIAFGLIAALATVAGTHAPALAIDYRAAAAHNGGTLANAALQRDVMTQLHVAAYQYDKCPTVDVTQKTVIRFVNVQTPWIERWITTDCGHIRPATIAFKINPNGGTDLAVSVQR